MQQQPTPDIYPQVAAYIFPHGSCTRPLQSNFDSKIATSNTDHVSTLEAGYKQYVHAPSGLFPPLPVLSGKRHPSGRLRSTKHHAWPFISTTVVSCPDPSDNSFSSPSLPTPHDPDSACSSDAPVTFPVVGADPSMPSPVRPTTREHGYAST